MKVIITENKLNKVIERYLEQQLGDLIRVNEPYGKWGYYVVVGKFISPHNNGRSQSFLVSEVNGDRVTLVIDERLHQTVMSMFSLEGDDLINITLKRLMKTKYGILINDVLINYGLLNYPH